MSKIVKLRLYFIKIDFPDIISLVFLKDRAVISVSVSVSV